MVSNGSCSRKGVHYVEAREGINTTEANLKVLDEVVSPLIRQGLFDQETYNAFKFREISPDDIILTPDLLK